MLGWIVRVGIGNKLFTIGKAIEVGIGIGIERRVGVEPELFFVGIANPVAAILSMAMMLEWLDDPRTREAAARVRNAVDQALADPANRTPDVGGSLTTSRMTDTIIAAL